MAPAHESETIVFNFRKLLSTLPNYAELEQILLFSVNWGKQVCYLPLIVYYVICLVMYLCLLFVGLLLLLLLYSNKSIEPKLDLLSLTH